VGKAERKKREKQSNAVVFYEGKENNSGELTQRLHHFSPKEAANLGGKKKGKVKRKRDHGQH